MSDIASAVINIVMKTIGWDAWPHWAQLALVAIVIAGGTYAYIHIRRAKDANYPRITVGIRNAGNFDVETTSISNKTIALDNTGNFAGKKLDVKDDEDGKKKLRDRGRNGS